ncbi:hypothetical protein [Granulicella mallensis]|uniref:DUF4239 domain-containing protein n=1 Tax=Granulicella mallensis TaxID=940614 RepID=A0A7W7ZRZ6_9BACT|nr:hypothetical protein [Granulicella mallensis]MBB5065018.1 hypothetical protein [Granulicella mallensis]
MNRQLYTSAMLTLLDHPLLFCPFVILFLFLGSLLGAWVRVRRAEAVARDAGSFKALEGAVLGLFALLLGFSFAMAVNRYDLRKQLEVEEANAIGTTWLRTDTLPEPARTAERQLLQQYVPVRLNFVAAGTDAQAIQRSLTQSGELQEQIWKIAAGDASARRDPVSALLLSSLNDTIDVTEKRTAALENRIPSPAWAILLFMAFVSSALVAISITSRSKRLLVILPVVVGVVFALILDLDSSRSGFIRVHQNSMMRVAAQIASSR